VPTYTLYGRAIWELGESTKLVKWIESIPPQSDQWPAYWLLAGQWAQREGRHDEAARAFWESLRLAPDGQLETLAGLMQSLDQLGRKEESAFLAGEISLRSTLRDAMKIHFERKESSQSAALGVAEAMAGLGRIWEAEAWGRLAVSLPNERVADIANRYLAIRNRLTTSTPWQLADSTLTTRINLSNLPTPQWSVAQSQPATGDVVNRGTIHFEDQAINRGLVHTCEVQPSAQTQGHSIFHTLGGGVGVIDLDLDGWPDLALAMLDGKPIQTDSAPNRLFRNHEGQFVDITEASGYKDQGFSHGIAIGDYNEDGFPDIFDANYGQNRLYRNNGDGTFQDVTREAGIVATGWSTSVVIADLDGDGVSDLFETHYCGGKMPLERTCKDGRGLTGTCPPLYFEAEPDRVWRGVGDGTFIDASDDWMDQSSPGRGLGIVVGQFDENLGLDLFVANDMTANHLWSATSSTDSFRLADLGLIRGLALNSKSLSQASMGIAVGDPNNDGLIDLFVTHFSDDHNTYYEQVRPGFWADRSAISGLAVPSIKMLGFGTQWYDFDNHGRPELIIANGHVDDTQSEDISYRMPPQLFRLNDDGKWTEPDRAQIGEYFTNEHLGRAVATGDFNRDGLGDVVITHLYAPVALLVNRSQQTGGRISIELKATQGSRDAIGTSITMTIDGRKYATQLTAGDGYLASNQRLIAVGMGDAKIARDIVIKWPSGLVQKIDQLTAGQEYLLVEGDAEVFQQVSR
jgi:tetratricopeptide (TPR) repeat protein